MSAPTILVADDDDAVREALCFLLNALGHEARAFDSGRSLLAVIEGYDQACIILDLTMPDMDGTQVLRALRSRGVAHPVIFLTGHGQEQLAGLPASLGVAAVLSKPCAYDELMAAINVAFSVES